MVKVGLNIKNGSKIFKPTPGDVVIFDGKDWYVTTKEELFKEEVEFLNKCKEELEELKAENTNFMRDVTRKIETMNEILTDMLNYQKGE